MNDEQKNGEKFVRFILENLHDFLIIASLMIFVGTMFYFVSHFVGWISLSVVLFIIGIFISIIKSKREAEDNERR